MAAADDSLTGPARTAPWYDPAKRAVFIQGLMIVLTAAFVIWIVNNTLGNLARLNIASGYGFLEERSGFGVPMSLIAYSPQSTYLRAFEVGLLNTLLVSAMGIVATSAILNFGVYWLSPTRFADFRRRVSPIVGLACWAALMAVTGGINSPFIAGLSMGIVLSTVALSPRGVLAVTFGATAALVAI